MEQLSTETRDDVMLTASLMDFLCQRIALEYKEKWEKSHPFPSVAPMVLTSALMLVLFIAGKFAAGMIFLIISCLLLGWILYTGMFNSGAAAEHRAALITRGHFPPESAGLVISRLRWWNHLIVPKHWARHSRIHDRKYRLEKKIESTEKTFARLKSEQADAEEVLDILPAPDVQTLAEKLTSWPHRLEYETTLAKVEKEIVRVSGELALYKALHHKVEQVTAKLEQIEKSSLELKNIQPQDLNDAVKKSIAALESRRVLVNQVDKIVPAEFLDLVRVDPPKKEVQGDESAEIGEDSGSTDEN